VSGLPPLGSYRSVVTKTPSEPVSADVVAAEAPLAAVAIRPADDVVATPEAEKSGIESVILERVGGVSVQLDINIERRRWLWWRLALSMVVRRLGR
jgi:hypothetical protein